VKAEYLYIAAASFEISHINEVRFGLNYPPNLAPLVSFPSMAAPPVT
jgi:hypothetical protein